MQIVVNGSSREIKSGMSLADLLNELGVDPTWIAVEKNRQIIKKEHYPEEPLAAGDHVEVVTLVGGG